LYDKHEAEEIVTIREFE